MKKIVGVLIVALVMTLGVYFYLNTDGIQAGKDSPATATVSAPVKTQKSEKAQEETKKPAPELKSFEGLDEELSGIFNGEGGNKPSSGDPLQAATQ